MIRNVDVLGIYEYFCVLLSFRFVVELELSWKILNIVFSFYLLGDILWKGRYNGYEFRFLYLVLYIVIDRFIFGKIRGRLYYFFKYEKILFFLRWFEMF